MVTDMMRREEWTMHIDGRGDISRIVYIKNKTLQHLIGSKNFDMAAVKETFRSRHPHLSMDIRGNVAPSGTDKYRLTGKDAAIYWMLGFPWLIPGIVYIEKKTKGYQFVIRGTL